MLFRELGGAPGMTQQQTLALLALGTTYKSNSATIGAWSEGLSQVRGSISIQVLMLRAVRDPLAQM